MAIFHKLNRVSKRMPKKTKHPANVMVRVTPATKTRLKVNAAKQNLSIGHYIEQLLEKHGTH
jgi:predicted HicB family RNase H-like nuclease